METLKLTTLVILIPVGLLISETAAAYPEAFGHTKIAGALGSEANCFPRPAWRPGFRAQGTTSSALIGHIAGFTGPSNTTPLPDGRDKVADTCRLDLDLIEAD